MFNFTAKAHSKNRIHLTKLLLAKTKVPILILDHTWLKNFVERETNEIVKDLEKRLLDLLKETSHLTERLKELDRNKKNHLHEIITLTTEAYEKNNTVAKERINELQEMVLNINKELQETEKTLNGLPEELETTNITLLEETVNSCYEKMMVGNERLSVINPQVENLREQLKTLVGEKAVLEEEVSKSYTLLHSLVGKEIIELIDKEQSRLGNKKWF